MSSLKRYTDDKEVTQAVGRRGIGDETTMDLPVKYFHQTEKLFPIGAISYLLLGKANTGPTHPVSKPTRRELFLTPWHYATISGL